MLIGLTLALGYYLIEKKKTSSSASSAQTAATSGTTNSSLIPQFVNQVYTNGSPPAGHNMRTGTQETTPPASTPSGSTTSWANPYIVAVPNGSGGWMEAIFPNQTAVNNYYSDVGYNNGYPLGLNKTQITSAVTQAGGNVAATVANSGPGGLLQ